MGSNICIFGEVLFDHFPDGKRVLGGAPFNVAWHLQAFGIGARFISRVGNDEEGRLVREAMQDWGMDTSGLQTDSRYPTGRVEVSFSDGEPSYDIVAPSAWDRIEPETGPSDCDLFYHGSLALRDAVSRGAAESLLARKPRQVFVDVNLRPPWWQREQVLSLMQRADWVKLNGHELEMLADDDADEKSRASAFVERWHLDGLIVTRGASGAELLTGDGKCFSVTPRADIEVVDTVGAGDAFTSVILFGLASGWPLDTTLERAQAFASAQVGRQGATVDDLEYYRQIKRNWK